MKERIADETSNAYPSKETIDTIIRNHVWGAAGVGLIPLPLADFAVLTGIQLNMLRKLAEIYHVPFRKDRVKNILTSLIGGAFPSAVSGILAASIAKAVPLIGQTAGAATMPLLAGAVTYSVGKVFVQHFASGGTFLTFDPEEVRAYYADMLKEGETVVKTVSPSPPQSEDMKMGDDLREQASARAEEKTESPETDDIAVMPEKRNTETEETSEVLSDDSHSVMPEKRNTEAEETSEVLSEDSHAVPEQQGYAEDSFSYPDSTYEMAATEESIAEVSDDTEGAAGESMTDTAKPKRRKKKKK